MSSLLSWVCPSVKTGMAHTMDNEEVKDSLCEPGSRLMNRHKKIKIYKQHFRTQGLSWQKRRCQRNIKWNKYPTINIYELSTFLVIIFRIILMA